MTMSRKATARLGLMLFSTVLCSRGARTAERAPELHVHVSDYVGLDDRLLDAMRSEVEDIYSDTGVRIFWLEDRPPDPAKAYEARAYILDELPASLRSLFHISKSRAPMAITLGPRPTAPGADIFISRKAVLGRASHRHALVAKHAARALGRTLAHELAHRFLGSGHTERGILKATLKERDLIDWDRSDIFFTHQQARLLKSIASRSAHPTGRERQ